MSKFSRFGSFRKSSRGSDIDVKPPLSPSISSPPTSPISPSSLFSVPESLASTAATATSPTLDFKKGSPYFAEPSDHEPPPYSATGSGLTGSKERLLLLAKELGVPLSINLPQIGQRDVRPSLVTEADKEAALKMLNERRLTDPDYKPPSGLSKLTKSKAKIAEINPKEVSRAFNAAVEAGGPLGVVEAFLEMGADVDLSRRASTSMMKKLTKKDQADQKSFALQIATRNHSLELIELLASRAGQATLDESLLIAVLASQTEKVRILLGYNASVVEAHDEFLFAVARGPEEMVMLLLVARQGPCNECRAAGLVKAVERQSQELVNAFLASRADTDYHGAEALLHAFRSADLGAALSIVANSQPPSPENLDQAAVFAFQQNHIRDVQVRSVEICLCGGARGPGTQRLLVDVATSEDAEMVLLLLQHQVSLNYNGGQAICCVIERGSEPIFDAMLKNPLDASSLGNALTSAAQASQLGLEFVSKLLGRGASPNHQTGQPLIAAVSAFRNDVLKKMLSKKPSKAALSAALSAALHLSGHSRVDAITTLTPAGIDQSALDAGLILLAEEAAPHHEAMTAMMKAGALPDAQNARSVVCVACRYDTETLGLLTPFVSAPSFTFSEAAAAVAESSTWRDPQGLNVLQFLLEQGGESRVLDGAVREAARLFDMQALSFLSDWVDSTEVYTVAFADAIDVGDGVRWLDAENFDVIQLLLDKRAQGPVIDAALIQAVGAFLEDRTEEILVDVLLEHGADVNNQDGLAIEIAVRAGELSLVEKLLNFGPEVSSLSIAFSTALVCDHSVQVVLGLLELLAVRKEARADVNHVAAGVHPLYLALQHYPSSVPLVKRLCELGCNVNAQVSYKVYGEDSEEVVDSVVAYTRGDTNGGCDCDDCRIQNADGTGKFDAKQEMEISEEQVSVLVWACCQTGDDAVSPPVLEALLVFKATINFTTTKSRTTALLLAARYERPDLVQVLLKFKPEVSAKDSFGRSALFFAAGNGDVKSTKMLLRLKPRVNDGALHEAARGLHPDCVASILKGGHDANFSSTKHGGLTALGELCMYSNGASSQDHIETCIDLLSNAKMEPLKKWRGKTMLYMAMDNPNPVVLTSVLVERIMYKYMTHNANVYSHDKLNYSPSMYLKKGYFLGDAFERENLIQLLRNHGGEDVFYADEGTPQPDDAIGMPQAVLQDHRRRRQHDEEQQRHFEKEQARLQADWARAQQQMQIAEMQNSQYLEHQSQRFDQRYQHQAMTNLQALGQRQELAVIKAKEERHSLVMKQQANVVLAQRNRNQIETKMRINSLQDHADRQKILTNYQIKRQNAHAALVQEAAKQRTVAMGTQKAIAQTRATYAKNAQRRITYR